MEETAEEDRLPEICRLYLAAWSDLEGVDVSALPSWAASVRRTSSVDVSTVDGVESLSRPQECLPRGPNSKAARQEAKAARLSRDAVEAQSLKARESTLWSCVKAGDARALLQHLRNKPHHLRKRGPLGETILHMLTLYGHVGLAKALAARWPNLIVDQYLEPQYRGENCVHIAIVLRNADLVSFFLDVSSASGTLRDVLAARADGDFFKPGRPCHFGESLLGFAVCTNQPRLVRDLVLKYGAPLDVEDTHGYNLMHMAVVHDLPGMFDVLQALWAEWPGAQQQGADDDSAPPKPLTARREWSAHNLSPLGLAAKWGQCEIFSHMLDATKQVQWAFGPVTCLWVPLRDFAMDQGRHASAIAHIVREGHLDLISLPLVQEVMDHKWERFAREVFERRFRTALLGAVAFSLMVMVPVPQGPGGSALFSHWGLVDWARACFHLACRSVCAVLVVVRLSSGRRPPAAKESGPRDPREVIESVANLGGCACFLLSQLLDFLLSIQSLVAPGSDLPLQSAADLPLAAAGLLAWLYLLRFLLGFRTTGPLVVMMVKILRTDIVQFASVSIVTIMGFALAFFVLVTKRSERGVGSFLVQFLEGFHVMTNGFEKDAHPDNGGLMALLVVYSVIVTVLLLNILVAMMNDTYSKVSEGAHQQWLLERARIINSIEADLVRSGSKRNEYWMEVEGEQFIQIENVSKAWKAQGEVEE